MFVTTVEFSVGAPVAGPGSEVSPALDALVARWRNDPEVSSVVVAWKALPHAGGLLIGAADVRAGLRAESRAALRKTYDRLARQLSQDGALRLGGRSCVLTDLFA